MPENQKAIYRKSQAQIKQIEESVLANDVLLLNIFSSMTHKQLQTLKRVCKKWRTLIDESIQKRKKFIETKLFESGKWTFKNGANGIEYLQIEKEKFLKDFIKDLPPFHAKPKACIFFLTSDFFMHQNCIINSSNRYSLNQDAEQHPEIVRRKNVKECAKVMANLLPKNSLNVFICAEGLIWDCLEYVGNSIDQPKIVQFPSIAVPPVNPAIGGIFIPEHENYSFKIKHLSNETNLLLEVHDEQSLLNFLDVKSNESLKLIYILINDFFGRLEQPLNQMLTRINSIRSRIGDGKNDSKNFAVVGNQASEVYVHNLSKEYTFINDEITILSLVCKKGCASVQVAQMVLQEKSLDFEEDVYDDADSDEENPRAPPNDERFILKENLAHVFEKKATMMNDSLIDYKNDNYNAFVLYNTNGFSKVNKLENYKTSLFKSFFPNVRIVGCLGYSQIGHDFFPINRKENVSAAPNSTNKFNYDATFYNNDIYESSIFTMITMEK